MAGRTWTLDHLRQYLSVTFDKDVDIVAFKNLHSAIVQSLLVAELALRRGPVAPSSTQQHRYNRNHSWLFRHLWWFKSAPISCFFTHLISESFCEKLNLSSIHLWLARLCIMCFWRNVYEILRQIIKWFSTGLGWAFHELQIWTWVNQILWSFVVTSALIWCVLFQMSELFPAAWLWCHL